MLRIIITKAISLDYYNLVLHRVERRVGNSYRKL